MTVLRWLTLVLEAFDGLLGPSLVHIQKQTKNILFILTAVSLKCPLNQIPRTAFFFFLFFAVRQRQMSHSKNPTGDVLLNGSVFTFWQEFIHIILQQCTVIIQTGVNALIHTVRCSYWCTNTVVIIKVTSCLKPLVLFESKKNQESWSSNDWKLN